MRIRVPGSLMWMPAKVREREVGVLGGTEEGGRDGGD